MKEDTSLAPQEGGDELLRLLNTFSDANKSLTQTLAENTEQFKNFFAQKETEREAQLQESLKLANQQKSDLELELDEARKQKQEVVQEMNLSGVALQNHLQNQFVDTVIDKLVAANGGSGNIINLDKPLFANDAFDRSGHLNAIDGLADTLSIRKVLAQDCYVGRGCYSGMFDVVASGECSPNDEEVKINIIGKPVVWFRELGVDKGSLDSNVETFKFNSFTIPALLENIPDDCLHDIRGEAMREVIRKIMEEAFVDAYDNTFAGYDANAFHPATNRRIGVAASGNHTVLPAFPSNITTPQIADYVIYGIMQLKFAGARAEDIRVVLPTVEYTQLMMAQNALGYVFDQLFADCSGNVKCPINGVVTHCKVLDASGDTHWVDLRNNRVRSHGGFNVRVFTGTNDMKRNTYAIRMEQDYSWRTFCPTRNIVHNIT